MQLRPRQPKPAAPAGPAKQAKGVQKKTPAKAQHDARAPKPAKSKAAAKKGKKDRGRGKAKVENLPSEETTPQTEGTSSKADDPDPFADASNALEAEAGPSSAQTQLAGPNEEDAQASRVRNPRKAGKGAKKGATRSKADPRGKGKGKGKEKAGAGSKSAGPRALSASPPGSSNVQFSIETNPTQLDPLRPHSTRIQKWGRYALPPFGKPFWKVKNDRPTLMIPVLVDPADKDRPIQDEDNRLRKDGDWDPDHQGGEDDDEAVRVEVERLRDESNQDPGNAEKKQAYRNYTGQLTYGTCRRLGDDFVGEIQAFWDKQEEEERQREIYEEEQGRREIEGDPNNHDEGVASQDGTKEQDKEAQGVRSTLNEPGNPISISSTPPTGPELAAKASSLSPDPENRSYDPRPFDVPGGTEIDGATRSSDVERGLQDWAPFIRSAHGYEEGWVGRKPLGAGSQAIAGMWERRDDTGRIVDQVVIKRVGINHMQTEWNPHKPFEVDIMEDLRDRPNNGIVNIRGYRRYPKSKAHRIYMDYCEHGNLQRIISAYRDKKRHIPEEFIWDIFYHMANACRVMAQGPSEPRRPWQDTYVHCDIKPENIFLAAPRGYDEDGIPIYPTAKLGDFGLAMSTGENDPRNPALLKGVGTEGYRAPEQKLTERQRSEFPSHSEYRDDVVEKEIEEHSPKFSSKTNIWELGACIFKLLELRDASYAFYGKIRKGEVMNKIKTTREPEYSQDLIDLVHQCLKFYPHERPDEEQLLSTVVRNRDKFRNLWKTDPSHRIIPREAILYYTREAWNDMESGSWVRPERDAPSEDPPTSYPSVEG